jgi:hypothetical protein
VIVLVLFEELIGADAQGAMCQICRAVPRELLFGPSVRIFAERVDGELFALCCDRCVDEYLGEPLSFTSG